MNPYAFIVGCPRSGTSLLQRMVDAHPVIAITPETNWIARALAASHCDGDVPVTGDLVERVTTHRRFGDLGIDEVTARRLAGKADTFAAFVSAIFDLYGQKQDKELVGDKTPGYVRSIPTLNGLFPEARFAHIIRDGRDVCLSLLNWDKLPKILGRLAGSEDYVFTAALFWEWNVRLGREAGLGLGPRLYYELRYESLVRQPEATSAALCRFLDLPYDARMVGFHEGRTRHEPGLSAKRAWLPVTAGLRDWRRQMPPGDAARFEAVAGDLLEELGYPRSVARLPGSVWRRATELRASFSEHAAVRGSPLPRSRWAAATQAVQ